MSRLTRKEIKRDEVLETLTSIMHWIGDNTRNLLVGFAVLLLLILAAAGFYGYRQGREADAGEKLAEAVEILSPPVGPDATGAPGAESSEDAASRGRRARELFEEVQEEYSGTTAAQIADVYLGEIAASEGSLATARAHWEGYVAGQKDNMLASTVRVNLMSLDRLEGRGEELVAELEADLASGASALPTDVLLYQLAVTQEEVGDADGAQATWSRLVEEHPDSPFAGEARSRGGAVGPLPGVSLPGV